MTWAEGVGRFPSGFTRRVRAEALVSAPSLDSDYPGLAQDYHSPQRVEGRLPEFHPIFQPRFLVEAAARYELLGDNSHKGEHICQVL